MSMIRDPETYEKFEHVVLVHGVRFAKDLGYSDYIQNELPEHEYLSEQVKNQLLYYPTVTREPFKNRGRITDLLGSGKLSSDVGLPGFDPEQDRVMICGSEAMNADVKALLESRGFIEGTNHAPGSYALEKAFVTK